MANVGDDAQLADAAGFAAPVVAAICDSV